MNNFSNDYNDICHEDIFKALYDSRDEINGSYGNDLHTKEAVEIMREKIAREDIDIHFIHGGTMANILALSHGLRPYEGIISASTGHIVGNEAGAIEATGHQVILIDTEDGKLTAGLIKERLEAFGVDHKIIPKIVYISNTTELGTVYSKEEIEEIYKYCKENNMYLYIDGARLGVAMASEKSNLSMTDLPNICDIFTLGGTKNGALFGEALVICNDSLKDNFRFSLKQRGAMLAKGHLMGIQYKTLFKDNLYMDIANKTMEMSRKLIEGLKEKEVEFYITPESNQIFIVADENLKNRLERNNNFEISRVLPNKDLVLRFVVNYRTSEEEIKNLLREF